MVQQGDWKQPTVLGMAAIELTKWWLHACCPQFIPKIWGYFLGINCRVHAKLAKANLTKTKIQPKMLHEMVKL